MKIKWTRLCAKMLAMLGVGASASSCDLIGVMYGSPYVEYSVEGKVTNEEGQPIAGISVRGYTAEDMDSPAWESGEIAKTREDGTYKVEESTMSLSHLLFRDIDGKEGGGEFEAKIVKVDLIQVKKGDGKDFLGGFKSRGPVNVTLKRVSDSTGDEELPD